MVSLWILISVNEFKEKPIILSPQLISSAAIKKQNALRINQIKEFIDFLFLVLTKIKIPNNEEIKYSANCSHSSGPSSIFNKSNHVNPIIVLPKGSI